MDNGLTSAERTIPAAFHNLNNAANFLMLISNADDVRPELRELALAWALALGTVHNTVSDLRAALTRDAAMREIVEAMADAGPMIPPFDQYDGAIMERFITKARALLAKDEERDK